MRDTLQATKSQLIAQLDTLPRASYNTFLVTRKVITIQTTYMYIYSPNTHMHITPLTCAGQMASHSLQAIHLSSPDGYLRRACSPRNLGLSGPFSNG